jgi:hypothetical protein
MEVHAMTTEAPMRERIARAVARELCVDEINWRAYAAISDAVLDAMREPDSYMRLQATRYWTNPGASWSQDGSIICWRVMIDAAKEGK